MRQFKIGEYVYPRDNSFQINLTTGEKSHLAGVQGEDPKHVEIVSEPYKEKVEFTTTETNILEKEFVNVKYGEDIYRCLNSFSISMPEGEPMEYWEDNDDILDKEEY